MTYTKPFGQLAKLSNSVFKSSSFITLAVMAAFIAVAMQPAQAQSSDRWKSLAIIGGSTAVGAYVGHKVAGTTGALVGAGVGATVGYQIDQRRRANEYSQYGYYGDPGGYYGNNGGNYGDGGGYGNTGGYYGNGGYNGPSDGGYYPSGLQSNHGNRISRRQR
jgi:hypothetical protein